MVEAAGFVSPSFVDLRHGDGDLAFVGVVARRP
jgi:hypothetical protein